MNLDWASPVQGLTSHTADGILTLKYDNPEIRNALTDEVLTEFVRLMSQADCTDKVRCILIEGSVKVFASGADIRSLAHRTPLGMYANERIQMWHTLRAIKTPKVACVSGLCLGGGLELALLCDVILASDTARFGLPETQLGLIPGAGGTQLLPRIVGRPVAMDMILTGRLLDAHTAEQMGLVSRMVDAGDLHNVATQIASTVASRSAVAVLLAKTAVISAYETTFTSGLETERALFGLSAASDDAAEGIAAFMEKRDPEWRHR